MKKLLILIAISLFAIGCTSTEDVPTTNEQAQTDKQLVFNTSELSEYDGKSGNNCYVAVSGRVYEISNSNKWINGDHLDSDGQASCGRDLTEAMAASPHGISILTTSPKVKQIGTLE
jgi:predicted heme/steroid binding protein